MTTERRFYIRGGVPLEGDVQVCGGKNTSVAILAAALLCDEPVRVENLPDISDTRLLLAMMEGVGARITREGASTVVIDPRYLTSVHPDDAMSQSMRASYYLLGALLGKTGEGMIAHPGGCAIGSRPIDQHVKGFRALGAEVDDTGPVITARAANLQGNEIFMDCVTVGGTINIMLAACRAQGNTMIYNAAKEPHIVDTANFLNAMGAHIRGAGTDVIRIRGGRHLHGTNYAIIPDQIETGTLMIAAAATGGDVTITGAIPSHMESLSAKLLEMGVSVYCEDDLIRVRSGGSFRSVNVKTQGYPGFPTDLQQPLSTLLTVARGTSIVTETIFESRFRFMDELRRMGASIRVIETTAIITGVDQLVGARVNATDLRAGAAMVVAGLMASGVTDIGGVDYILRGYEKIDQKLNSLGAQIELIDV